MNPYAYMKLVQAQVQYYHFVTGKLYLLTLILCLSLGLQIKLFHQNISHLSQRCLVIGFNILGYYQMAVCIAHSFLAPQFSNYIPLLGEDLPDHLSKEE